jgi:hypothetical protein
MYLPSLRQHRQHDCYLQCHQVSLC